MNDNNYMCINILYTLCSGFSRSALHAVYWP